MSGIIIITLCNRDPKWTEIKIDILPGWKNSIFQEAAIRKNQVNRKQINACLLKIAQISGIVIIVEEGARIEAPDPGNIFWAPDKIASRIMLNYIFLEDKAHIGIVIFTNKIG